MLVLLGGCGITTFIVILVAVLNYNQHQLYEQQQSILRSLNVKVHSTAVPTSPITFPVSMPDTGVRYQYETVSTPSINTLEMSLRLVQAALYNPACVTTCANEGYMNPSTCECLCQPKWTGKYCTILNCNNNGRVQRGVCICDEGYDPQTQCATPMCNYGTYYAEIGRCICDNGYTGKNCDIPLAPGLQCSPYHYGAFCQYNCTIAGVLNNQCFLRLETYGRDQCASYEDFWICYCGGGYQMHTTDIKTTLIYGRTPFTAPMVILCAPEPPPSRPLQCMTDTCCIETSIYECALAGCSELNGTCASAHLGYSPLQIVSQVTKCLDEPLRCNPSLRALYLYYYSAISLPLYKSREHINMLPWASLSLLGAHSDFLFTLSSGISLVPVTGTPGAVNIINVPVNMAVLRLLQLYNSTGPSNYVLTTSNIASMAVFYCVSRGAINTPALAFSVDITAVQIDSMCSVFDYVGLESNVYYDTKTSLYLSINNNTLTWSESESVLIVMRIASV